MKNFVLFVIENELFKSNVCLSILLKARMQLLQQGGLEITKMVLVNRENCSKSQAPISHKDLHGIQMMLMYLAVAALLFIIFFV